MTVIIGLAGRMRTGKSTLAHLLSQQFDWPVFSFAEALRDELSVAWFRKDRGTSRFFWNQAEQRGKAAIRPLLQAWGQGRRDLLHPDYWIEQMWLRIRTSIPKPDIAIVDDVRHANEMMNILENGGVIIHLYAHDFALKERGADTDGLNHNSETSLESALKEARFYRDRIFSLDTSGMTPHGAFKRLMPFVFETLGDEEE